jgi:hypothetical protein
LADAFPVTLARPRDRRTLTENPQYQHLKTDITSYLVNLNREARASRGSRIIQMPAVTPREFRPKSRVMNIGGNHA